MVWRIESGTKNLWIARSGIWQKSLEKYSLEEMTHLSWKQISENELKFLYPNLFKNEKAQSI